MKSTILIVKHSLMLAKQNEELRNALDELEEIDTTLVTANATFMSLEPEQQKFHIKDFAELLQKINNRANRVRARIQLILRA